MTRIKICGITTEEEIRLCVEAGAHALGFVTEYPVDVPWNLHRDEALNLLRLVPPFVYRIIVVGDDFDTVLSLAKLLKPHAVQLHADEPLNVTKDIVSALSAMGVDVIKALRFSVSTGRCNISRQDPLEAAKLIESTGVSAIVMDSISETRPAGTGKSIDWALARRIRDTVSVPVILAGGLTPDNVARAVATVNPYAVDVISGVEDDGRKKNPRKVRKFIAAASEEKE